MININNLKRPSWECVHYVRPEKINEIEKALSESPLKIIRCDVKSVTGEVELFSILSNALEFPEYFGGNWDSTEECLCDLEWLPAKGYVLLLLNSEYMWRGATYTAGNLVSIWLSVAQRWGEEETPFHLVFSV